MKWTKAFAFAASLTWAIQGDWLARVLTIANREGAGVEAVEKELGRPLDNTQSVTVRDGVAVLPLIGPIFRRANMFTEVSGATSIDIVARDFAAALADPSVKAILLNVDSPGGEITGINEFAQMIADARGKKPCVAYVGGLGCSAAYWIASAADRIVADPTAQVGSIGVVQAMPNPAADTAADIEIVSSQSPKKRPNVATESGRAVIQHRVDALADVFVAAVARYRGTSQADVLDNYGRGATLVGEAAKRAGMVDAIGSFEATLTGLARGDYDDDGDDDKEQDDMDKKVLAKKLGLPETASDADIDKALDERQALLGALGATSASEAIGAAHGLAQTAKIAQDALSRAERLEAEGRDRDVAKILDDNKERITPAMKPVILANCGANAEGKGADPVRLRALVAVLPKQTGELGGDGHGAPPAARTGAGAPPEPLPKQVRGTDLRATLLFGGQPDLETPAAREVMAQFGVSRSRVETAWNKRVERAQDLPGR